MKVTKRGSGVEICLSRGPVAWGGVALLLLASCGAGMEPTDAEDVSSVNLAASSTTYEAESALLSGPIKSTAHAGYTGTGFVDYQAASGDFVEWTVNAPTAGAYTLAFRYANGGGSSRPLAIEVNGAVASSSLPFPSTGGWTAWSTVSLNAQLSAGSNKVRATAIGQSGGDLDNLRVTAVANPVLAVRKTAGCGLAATQATGTFVRYTVGTSGTKAANCADRLNDGTAVCGPWALVREYFVWLPVGYDPNKAYPLVFQMTGCGGTGRDVYTLNNGVADGAGNSVIRVGLTPPPNSVGHGTNPGQGCYDDKEGDDSVDLVFYEKLRDTLKGELCYDDNRVFASGNSSGSWMANEMVTKYAGNANGYALRGIAVNTGGLPTTAAFTPVATNSPMAGMWVHELQDPVNPFTGTKVAINRAMTVNGCTGTNYDTAQFDNYPIGGGNADTTCKLIKGCPAIYPLVVCALPGSQHASHDSVANPGFSKFLSAFTATPFTN